MEGKRDLSVVPESKDSNQKPLEKGKQKEARVSSGRGEQPSDKLQQFHSEARRHVAAVEYRRSHSRVESTSTRHDLLQKPEIADIPTETDISALFNSLSEITQKNGEFRDYIIKICDAVTINAESNLSKISGIHEKLDRKMIETNDKAQIAIKKTYELQMGWEAQESVLKTYESQIHIKKALDDIYNKLQQQYLWGNAVREGFQERIDTLVNVKTTEDQRFEILGDLRRLVKIESEKTPEPMEGDEKFLRIADREMMVRGRLSTPLGTDAGSSEDIPLWRQDGKNKRPRNFLEENEENLERQKRRK